MLAMQGAPAAKGVKTLRNTPLPWEEEEDSAKIRNPSVGPRLSFQDPTQGRERGRLRAAASNDADELAGQHGPAQRLLVRSSRRHLRVSSVESKMSRRIRCSRHPHYRMVRNGWIFPRDSGHRRPRDRHGWRAG